mgnify:CR=1 FL=1
MELNKIPATIVTGFLGSGKTTLLSSLLKQAKGKRIAVIVNEFGELDIDADLLRSCPLSCEDDEEATAAQGENGIYELANGCICCTVEEEFLPVMKELVARRDDIDHILIETSGLALPKPLVQAFNWPDIKQYCTVDAVITLIDGPAVAAGRFANDVEQVEAQRQANESLDHDPSLNELLDDQLSAADLVIVGKNDLLDETQRLKVQQVITAKVPASVKTIYTRQAASNDTSNNGSGITQGTTTQDPLSLETIMGIDAASEDKIEALTTHHDHHHDHGEHHEHAHDHFDSFVISLGEVDSTLLQTILTSLLEKHNIYRAKGFVAMPGKPMRQVIQAVGERMDVYFDRLWEQNEARTTQLVFIGKGLDQSLITDALAVAQLELTV